jgi:hypothetical protein
MDHQTFGAATQTIILAPPKKFDGGQPLYWVFVVWHGMKSLQRKCTWIVTAIIVASGPLQANLVYCYEMCVKSLQCQGVWLFCCCANGAATKISFPYSEITFYIVVPIEIWPLALKSLVFGHLAVWEKTTLAVVSSPSPSYQEGALSNQRTCSCKRAPKGSGHKPAQVKQVETTHSTTRAWACSPNRARTPKLERYRA